MPSSGIISALHLQRKDVRRQRGGYYLPATGKWTFSSSASRRQKWFKKRPEGTRAREDGGTQKSVFGLDMTKW